MAKEKHVCNPAGVTMATLLAAAETDQLLAELQARVEQGDAPATRAAMEVARLVFRYAEDSLLRELEAQAAAEEE